MSVSGRAALAATGGLLVYLSLPPFGLYLLAWLAFVPLLVACHRQTVLRCFILGLVFGLTWRYSVYTWVYEVANFRWYQAFPLKLFTAMAPALWCALLAFLQQRSSVKGPPLIAGAALWVVITYLSGNVGFLSHPWDSFAHTQHRNLPLLQLVSITGEYGLTGLGMLFNIAIARLVLQRDFRGFALTFSLVALVTAMGVGMLSNDRGKADYMVAALQPAIELERHRRLTTYPKYRIHEAMSRRVAQDHSQLDLLVWPESAISGDRSERMALNMLRNLAIELDTSIVSGVTSHRKYKEKGDNGTLTVNYFNSAYFADTDRTRPLTIYHKNVLLPFAERVPLENVITLPEWLMPPIIPSVPGNGFVHFDIGEVEGVPIICWENIFSNYVRQAVRGSRNSVLLHIVNDAWFGDSIASEQHNMSSILRAVENRIPVIVASNTGPSLIADAHGRVLSTIEGVNNEGVVAAKISPRTVESIYSRFGDIIVFLCLVYVVAVFIPSEHVRRKVH